MDFRCISVPTTSFSWFSWPFEEDLCTDCPAVQEKIASYLSHLVELGVAGIRLDAAKHIATQDLAQIFARVTLDMAPKKRLRAYLAAVGLLEGMPQDATSSKSLDILRRTHLGGSFVPSK